MICLFLLLGMRSFSHKSISQITNTVLSMSTSVSDKVYLRMKVVEIWPQHVAYIIKINIIKLLRLMAICNLLSVSFNTTGWIIKRISLLVAVSSHDSFSDPLFRAHSNWRDNLMSWFYRMSSPYNIFTVPFQAQNSFPCKFAICSPIRYSYILMERQTTVRKDT